MPLSFFLPYLATRPHNDYVLNRQISGTGGHARVLIATICEYRMRLPTPASVLPLRKKLSSFLSQGGHGCVRHGRPFCVKFFTINAVKFPCRCY